MGGLSVYVTGTALCYVSSIHADFCPLSAGYLVAHSVHSYALPGTFVDICRDFPATPFFLFCSSILSFMTGSLVFKCIVCFVLPSF